MMPVRLVNNQPNCSVIALNWDNDPTFICVRSYGDSWRVCVNSVQICEQEEEEEEEDLIVMVVILEVCY